MNIPILTYASSVTGSRDYASDHHIALAQDLATLARLGFQIVPLQQIVDALLCNHLSQLERCVGLSFDCGSKLDIVNIDLNSGAQSKSFLGILKDSGDSGYIQATSFVKTACEVIPVSGTDVSADPVWWAEDWWMVAEKSGFIKVENGGWAVDDKPPEDDNTAHRQIAAATQKIDTALGRGYCRLFAYPRGQSNSFLTREYLPNHYPDHGIQAAFTTEARPVSEGDDRWSLPRFVCGRDWTSPQEFSALLGEVRPRPAAPPAVASLEPVVVRAGPVNRNYQGAWDARANTDTAAIAAVDGSTSEETLQRTGQYSARQVRAALNLQMSDRVIELGCGVGRIGRELAPYCKYWLGADISLNMLNLARRRLNHIDGAEFLHLQRAALSGIEDNYFDKAYSVAVFCHMDKEDMFLYLQELVRTLKPGGWCYFETWNLSHPVGWKRWQYEVRLWAYSAQTERKEVARNQFSVAEEVRVLTSQAGFEIGACYNDSPWVQTVAIKPGAEKALPAVYKYLEKHVDVIANDTLFSDCFSRHLDVTYGVLPARDYLAWLETQDESASVLLYRDTLLELWARNQGRWGPVPEPS